MAGVVATARSITTPARWPVRIGALGHRQVLVGILVGAAAIRLSWTLVAAPPPESDFRTFLEMARLIGQGTWWPESYGWVYQGPGYPLLIAPLTLLGGATLPAIYALNIGLGVLTVALVDRLGSTLFSPRAGLVAAAFTAAFPGLWAWTPVIAAENLSVPMLIGIAVLLAGRPRGWTWPALGVLTGLLVFVRPSMLLFVVVVAISLVWLTPVGRKGRALALFAAGVALSMGVLGAANLLAGGPALPVGNSGWQPWLVHNERATGGWFPAKDRDDYPFRGMEDDAALAGIVRAAQQKLALEFVLLDPQELLPGVVQRHVVDWQTDEAGLDWTIRGAAAGQVAASLEPVLDHVVDGYYVVIMGAALLGIWLLGARPVVVLALVLPLAYLVAPVVIAEGNARYHVHALAYLAVLAGAAMTSRSWTFGLVASTAVAGVWLAPPGLVLGPWLIVAIVAVGVAALGLDALRNVRRWAGGASRRWLHVVLVAAVVGAELGVAVGLLGARQVVIDWSRTRPDGWAAYQSGATPGMDAGPVDLVASDVSSRFTKVSYPDAAVLSVPPSAEPGGRVGLARTFPDLEVGARYVVYLQVLDAGSSVATGRLTVLLNDRVVWEASTEAGAQAGWHDVVVPWRADTPFASVRVERSVTSVSSAPDVLVRSVHVYPKY